MKKPLHFLAFALVHFGGSELANAADSAAVGNLKSKHQATVASISSLHLKFEVGYSPKLVNGDARVEYWMDRGEYRLRLNGDSGRYCDSHSKNGKIQSSYKNLSADGAGSQKGGVITNATDGPIEGDPYSLCLLTVPGASRFRVPFATVLEESHRATEHRFHSENGNEYEIVALTHSKAKMEIWFSKQHNYLIQKLRIWQNPDDQFPIGEQIVEDFQEVSAGVYFPKKVVSKSFVVTDGSIKVIRTTTARDIQINTAIAPAAFAFRFPAGINVTDSIQKKIWTTGAAGETVTEAKSADGIPITLYEGTLQPAGLEGTPTTATVEEPKSATRWILPISLVLITAGIILYAIRRFRKPRLA